MRVAHLVVTWIVLMALLAATIAVTFLPIGAWRQVANLAIAGAKAALVLSIFMKLRQESVLVRLIAAMAATLLLIFAGMLMSDYHLRPPADATIVAPILR